MTLYHTVIFDGRVLKYNTLLAPSPEGAMMRAVGEWRDNGGDPITKMAVYEYQDDDPEYRYQWAPPGTFEDRPNLLEKQA